MNFRGGVKSVGPRFQPGDVQKENIIIRMNARRITRYLEAINRFVFVGINTWFIVSQCYAVVTHTEGYSLLDLVNGRPLELVRVSDLGRKNELGSYLQNNYSSGCYQYSGVLLIQVIAEIFSAVYCIFPVFFRLLERW